MIIPEHIEISGRDFVKKYSDGGFLIERDGEKYSEAIDPADISREYTETDEPIDSGEEPSETEQKAAAFDYLMDGGTQNE